ncbi:MAG: hypothetical protein OEW77_08675 [Gemmatimonadota bacterium]|nr:hypothetical protein [Gemmatimonadota bacterium]
MIRLALVLLLVSAPAALTQTASVSGPPMEVDAATRARLRAAMTRDLKNLVVAEEAYFADHAEYGRTFARGAIKGVELKVSPGATVTLIYVTRQAYAARVTHDWLPGTSCVMTVGEVPPSRKPATTAEKKVPAKDGVPVCDSK